MQPELIEIGCGTLFQHSYQSIQQMRIQGIVATCIGSGCVPRLAGRAPFRCGEQRPLSEFPGLLLRVA